MGLKRSQKSNSSVSILACRAKEFHQSGIIISRGISENPGK
jgi:hypothetical protein